jgi:hypothetical protein
MKIGGLLILLFVCSLAGFGQASETRAVAPFKGIKSGEAIDVYLKKGDKESVLVEMSGGKLSDVLTDVVGTTLRIEMRSGSYKNRSVKVYVTYVNLEKLSASSASNIFSDGPIKTSSLEINASSAASIEISVQAATVSADVSSAAEIMLDGSAKSFQGDASSAGSIDAYDLIVDDVSASASSAGSIKITANKQINAEASSGGSIRYRGNPAKTNTSSSSGGSVKKSI